MLKPLPMTASAAALAFSLSFIPPALAAAAGTDYANPDVWLCRPGRTDACGASQDATIIAADGSLSRELFHPTKKPPIDCFYVYPTVTTQTTGNSDLTITPAEKNVVNAQFARFASQCPLFAPMYRQVTLTALRAVLSGKPMAVDRALGYGDVLAAWNYYLEHDNKGRRVVLVGHSQGHRRADGPVYSIFEVL